MKSIVRVIIPILSLTLAVTPLAGGQTIIRDTVAAVCGEDGLPDSTHGPYAKCALWMDHGRLKRGMPGKVIAISQPLAPLPLGQFVIGDSARRYAASYDLNAKRGGEIG